VRGAAGGADRGGHGGVCGDGYAAGAVWEGEGEELPARKGGGVAGQRDGDECREEGCGGVEERVGQGGDLKTGRHCA
jgi:hypothetical protein